MYLFSSLTRTLFLVTAIAGICNAQEALFPQVTAKNLDGKTMTLPSGFAGDLNLVLIAYDQDQQRDVNTWLEAAPELFKAYPGIPCYEVPTLGKEYKLAKFFIDRGMRYNFKKTEQRERTMTLYIDKTQFERSLQIPNENRIAVLLVDKKGAVLWREQGLYYDIKGNSLKATLAKLRGAAH